MGDVKALLDLNFKEGLLFCSLLLVAAIFLIQKWDWLMSRFGIVTKRKLAEDQRGADIEKLKTSVEANGKNVDKIFACMDEIRDDLKEISVGMGNL